MRVIMLAAAALFLASCATPGTGTGQQQASGTTAYPREAPTPPLLRNPRQKSPNGWPDIGYRPHPY